MIITQTIQVTCYLLSAALSLTFLSVMVLLRYSERAKKGKATKRSVE